MKNADQIKTIAARMKQNLPSEKRKAARAKQRRNRIIAGIAISLATAVFVSSAAYLAKFIDLSAAIEGGRN